MFWQRHFSRSLCTVGGLLLLIAPLRAQAPGQATRPEPYSATGPVTYGHVTYYGAGRGCGGGCSGCGGYTACSGCSGCYGCSVSRQKGSESARLCSISTVET